MHFPATWRASARTGSLSFTIADVARNILLAAVYFATARLGLAMAFAAEQVTVIWPPTGIALAAVLLFGYRMWPGIAFGAFFANILANEPAVTALGIACGNTLEALAGAWMLHRAGFDHRLARLRDVLILVFFPAVLSTMISATIGVTSLCLGGIQPWESYGLLWRLWWVGDAMGAVIVAPFLLVWGNRRHVFAYDKAEAAILLAGLATAYSVVFTMPTHSIAFVFIVFPFIGWAALRFLHHGVTLVTLLACSVTVWATLHGAGPFTPFSMEGNLMLMQLFIGMVAVTGLLLSAAITGQRESEQRLSADLKAMNDLYDYSIRLAAARDLKSALKEVLEASITITKADFGNIQVLNEEGTGLEIAVHKGFKQDFLEHFKCVPLRDRSSACGRPAGMEGRILIADVEKDPQFTEHRSIARSAGFRAVQSTPLLSTNGTLLGMLSTHFRQPQLPDERQLRLLDLYVLQAASLIERMRAEEALQQADRRKDQFLATLAHELRNPLAPIKNVLHVFDTEKAGEDITAEARDVMKRQVHQMTRLIEDLMDVSRVSRGKIILQKQPVTLQEAIQAAIETTAPLITEKQHQLTVSQPPEPIWLDADTVRLSQVFANLLNNAAKYTDTGGHIALTVAKEGKEAIVSIKDDGIGIPDKMLASIFDLFIQVDNSLERKQGGLGIGLTLVKELVELHGGTIKAASKDQGKGSEFTIRLPITDRKPDAISFRPSVPTGHSHRVLVVDDNVASAKTLGWTLELIGHEITLAHDAEAALATAKTFKPNVILLDIGLPGMNGYELCRRLRENPDTKDTIIIAQTGWGQKEHRQRSQEAGFNHHLVKPVDMSTLRELLGGLPKP